MSSQNRLFGSNQGMTSVENAFLLSLMAIVCIVSVAQVQEGTELAFGTTGFALAYAGGGTDELNEADDPQSDYRDGQNAQENGTAPQNTPDHSGINY